MSSSTFQYPASTSRTLNPAGRSLKTIVGMHDHAESDADFNLVQTLQDYKQQQLLNNKSVTSGCLTYAPMVFTPFVANTFTIPSFDILFNGEVVSIKGFNSADLTQNRITLPASQTPIFWSGNSNDPEDARIYAIFLEVWYQSLDPTTGQGYYLDPVTQLRYFYPYGCTSPDPANAESMPDDSVDIFATSTSGVGLYTTQRAQIQWRFNIQRLSLSYNFSSHLYGLDPDPAVTSDIITGLLFNGVYGQGTTSNNAPLNSIPLTDNIYQFTNMGSINGDTALWRGGDGNITNSLGTMDGYTYALPIAVMFQRNSGVFSLASNPFGCGNATTQGSGLLKSGVSGRFDSKLADQIFADDVVDTRQTVSLDSWDLDKIMREGFVDVITGNTRFAIERGDSVGAKAEALGSTLDYYISMAPTVIPNTFTLSRSWDGFANGFSSDLRTFYVTKQVTTSQKTQWLSSSAQSGPWKKGDAFSIALPVSSIATIASVSVQGFNKVKGVRTPINLLSGQITVSGLGSKTATVLFSSNLQGTAFDPGADNLYCTVGVQYPANTGVDLQKTPIAVDGGLIVDAASGKSLPVYGISEYEVQVSPLTTQVFNVTSINPEYSNIVFGTKIWIEVPYAGLTGYPVVVVGTNSTYTIPLANLNGGVSGLYPTRIWDLASGSYKTISSISIQPVVVGTTVTLNCVITIPEVLTGTGNLIMSFLAQDTAQLVYNAPVKGVTEIEETVLFGNYFSNQILSMDSRVVVEVQQYNSATNLTTIVLAAKDCTIQGIAGNDTSRYIWVVDGAGNLNSVVCSTVNFNGGFATVVLTGDYSSSTFLFCGSILPGLSSTSSLTLVERYIPYQGEGVVNRNYEIIHNDDNALVTTNGSGAAPIVGLEDVYPYDRELPISTTLPALVNWPDATLANIPLASLFDSNYVAMRQNNVEHTFEVPLHTNDFIPPMNKDTRKEVQFTTASTGAGRGFSQAIPHVGFAISPPAPRTTLGKNLMSTSASIVVYVNNATGSDSNDGLTSDKPKLTVTAALSVLPPVLSDPCSIQLADTNTPYSLSALQNTLQKIALGDGTVRSSVYYALGNLAYTIQEEGRLVITSAPGAVNPVVIDATGYSGYGNGPTSAFFIDNSRVIFNGITFKGFLNPAVYGIDSDVDFVGCVWTGNIQAGGFEQGCNVILDGGSIILSDGGVGMVVSSSELTAYDVNLTVATGANPGAFFVGERSSTLNLQTHSTDTLSEVNVAASDVVAQVEFNSSIVVTPDFQTNGCALLSGNSVLARTVALTPFLGGVTLDNSSNTITLLS